SSRPPIARRSLVPVPGNVTDLSTDNPDPELLPRVTPILRKLDAPHRLYGGGSMLPQLREEAFRQIDEIGGCPHHLTVADGTLAPIQRILSSHLNAGHRGAVEDPG